MAATRSAPATPAIVRGPEGGAHDALRQLERDQRRDRLIAERHIERLSGMVMPSIAGIEMAQ